jgi:hypothetical protein
LIINAGNTDPVRLMPQTEVILFIKFLFLASVVKPVFGFGIHTLDGTQICGTNTKIMHVRFEDIQEKTIVIVKCKFKNFLLENNYYLNFGVAEESGESYNFIEVLRGAACFEVGGKEVAKGIVDMSCGIESYESFELS